MNTYIILGAAGGYISGGPIYQRNKAIYLKQSGWQVYYISCCHGKVYIKGLEDFIIATCTFMCKEAYVFPKSRQKKLIDYIVNKIPHIDESSNIVIESGTYYTAYWGELLAKRLHAKHIIVYLDEKNDAITTRQSDFFRFKFNRKELACITKNTMIHIFSEFWDIDQNEAIGLPCYCSNTVEDYKSDITEKIIRKDFNIGYIGRIEKEIFKVILKGVIEFAEKYKEKNISFICFGGADIEVINEIKRYATNINNLTIFISGYIFPIPVEAIKKCDFFISAAGSASVSAKIGIPTLRMDVYSNKPKGIIKDIKNQQLIKLDTNNEIIDYLENIFIDKKYFDIQSYDINIDNKLMNEYLNEHIKFLERTTDKKTFYDISSIKCTLKEKIHKILISIFGMRILKYL